MELSAYSSLLVSYLRSKLPNPHPSGEWIYVDYPRSDATFPRISVTQTGGNIEPAGLGELGEEPKTYHVTLNYDIDIWVKVNDRVIIDGETYVGTKLRDKYADMVINALLSAKENWFSNHKVIDVEIVGISTSPLDEDLMLHRKTIAIRLTIEGEVK